MRIGREQGFDADVIYLKVDETSKKKFLAARSAPFKPFSHKPTVMSYFEVPTDILEDPDELIAWAEESLAIQKKQT